MAAKYIFSEEEIAAIEEVRKKNKDKRAEFRLKALELRAKGAKAREVAEQTEFYPTTITRLVEKYRKNGLEQKRRKVMPRSRHPQKASEADLAGNSQAWLPQ